MDKTSKSPSICSSFCSPFSREHNSNRSVVLWLILFHVMALLAHFSSTVVAEAGTPYSFATTDAGKAVTREYDYIVVGGGTAGCAIAATLSSEFSVLLVERGGSPFGVSSIENMEGVMTTLSNTDRYTSPAQVFVSEDGVPNARARVLGGGTALNFGFYSRASVDYMISMGWNLSLVEEAYEWVERELVTRPKLKTWQSAMIEALLEMGMVPYNGYTLEHIPGTKSSGTTCDNNNKRHTAADLLKYANPDNILVLLRATAKRVTFHPKENWNQFSSKPRVRGVEFMDENGNSYEALLKPNAQFCRLKGGCSEVILSAGALGSPQLLLLSGIGPAEHLKDISIPLVLDLPGVGKGMVDNPRNNITIVSRRPIQFSLPHMVGIVANSEAYIESISIVEQVGSYKIYKAYPIEKVANPFSNGELYLKTLDPRDNPSVRFNYFANPLDLAVCTRAMRTVAALTYTKALQSFVHTDDKEAIPFMGQPLPANITDEIALADFCRKTVSTIWHYHGGCRFDLVINRNYQVIGIDDDNLRVVDASTHASSPGTNPQATTMMLGRYMGLQILRERMGGIVPKP